MKSRILGFLPILVLAASAPPTSHVPAAGAWNVDWGDPICALTRHSGGSAPAILRIEWRPGYGELDLKWIEVGRLPLNRLQASEVFAEPGHSRVEAFNFAVLGPGQAVGAARTDIAFLNRLAAATALRLEKQGALLRELPVPEAAKAVAALRECNDSALREGGVDPASYAALRRVPKAIGGVPAWVRHTDYPERALRALASSMVRARLTVQTDGRVGRCEIVRPSGNQDLDTRTCQLLKLRGRYEPAIGPEGAPVIAPVLIWVRWRLD